MSKKRKRHDQISSGSTSKPPRPSPRNSAIEEPTILPKKRKCIAAATSKTIRTAQTLKEDHTAQKNAAASSQDAVPASAPLVPPDVDLGSAGKTASFIPITTSTHMQHAVARLMAIIGDTEDTSTSADEGISGEGAKQSRGNTVDGEKSKGLWNLDEQSKTDSGRKSSKGIGGTKSQPVWLMAKSKAANKLVGVVEIAKREMARKGWRGWQYTGLESRFERVEENKEKTGGKQDENGKPEVGRAHGATNEEDESEEEAFETMSAGVSRGSTVREIPILAIVLSKEEIKSMRRQGYGKQVFGLPKD